MLSLLLLQIIFTVFYCFMYILHSFTVFVKHDSDETPQSISNNLHILAKIPLTKRLYNILATMTSARNTASIMYPVLSLLA